MNKSKKWTNQEIEFLKKNIKNISYEELSIKLNRTIAAIKIKKSDLKIKKQEQFQLKIGEKINRLTILRMTEKEERLVKPITNVNAIVEK